MATNADAKTMAIVAEIFAAFPGRFRFTSGRRTVAQNAAVGGVPNSFHVKGQAADFVAVNGHYPPNEKEAIGRIVARHGYEVVFHNAGSGLHYHIEPAPGYVATTTLTTSVVPTPASNKTAFLAIAAILVVVILITD